MDQLSENVQAAREAALLNNYDSSLIFFQVRHKLDEHSNLILNIQGAINAIPQLIQNPATTQSDIGPVLERVCHGNSGVLGYLLSYLYNRLL